eukprot:scaffold362_cov176-Amphora_coffeaeformis.AAC.12
MSNDTWRFLISRTKVGRNLFPRGTRGIPDPTSTFHRIVFRFARGFLFSLVFLSSTNPPNQLAKMMFRKIFFVCASLLSATPLCFAQEDAERNIMMGMQGLAQAVNDPAALAQLVRDMQVSSASTTSEFQKIPT